MGNQAVTGIKMEAPAPAVVKTVDEWKAVLSPDTFRVARMHGTEPAWSGQLNMNKDAGTYHCACCGNLLFHSTQKFDSGSGWPSYTSVSTFDSIQGSNDPNLSICSPLPAHLFDISPILRVGCSGPRFFASHVRRI